MSAEADTIRRGLSEYDPEIDVVREQHEALDALLAENQRLREATLALVDAIAYCYPNPNSPNAEKWADWREDALNKAAEALAGDGE